MMKDFGEEGREREMKAAYAHVCVVEHLECECGKPAILS